MVYLHLFPKCSIWPRRVHFERYVFIGFLQNNQDTFHATCSTTTHMLHFNTAFHSSTKFCRDFKQDTEKWRLVMVCSNWPRSTTIQYNQVQDREDYDGCHRYVPVMDGLVTSPLFSLIKYRLDGNKWSFHMPEWIVDTLVQKFYYLM